MIRDDTFTTDEVIVKKTTPKALLVEIDGEEYWLPKSQLGKATDVENEGDIGTIEIPKWLAEEKGLTE